MRRRDVPAALLAFVAAARADGKPAPQHSCRDMAAFVVVLDEYIRLMNQGIRSTRQWDKVKAAWKRLDP